MKKVMVFGTFDKLHPGHLYLFREAKRFGDFLIAVVARDETVKKVKGKMPGKNERKRLENLKTISQINKVVLGNLTDQYLVIEDYNPDFICLGYDQHSFITENLKNEIEKRKLKAKIIRLRSYKPDIYKSSKLA